MKSSFAKLKKKNSDIMTPDDMTSPLTSEGMTSSDDMTSPGGKYGIRNYLHHFYEDCIGMERRDEDNKCSKPSRLVIINYGGLFFCIFSVRKPVTRAYNMLGSYKWYETIALVFL